MKKISLIFLALIPLSQTLAVDYTNKTFLMPRSISSFDYMERTGFHRLLQEQPEGKEKSGGTLEVVGFYRDSNNDTDVGRYFGTNHKNTVWIGNGTNTVPSTGSISTSSTLSDVDVDRHLFFHHYDYFNEPSSLDSHITLKPKQTVVGASLVYRHDFDKAFVKVTIPFAEVKNNLCASVSETKDDDWNKGILDYLSGGMDYSTTGSKMSPLQYLKIDGNSHNHSSIGDIVLSVGYQFSEKADYHCHAALNLIVPAGNKAKSEYMFEPIVGNGGHTGVGLEFESTLNLQRDSNSSLELSTNLKWTYLFEETEKRTLGFHSSVMSYQDVYSIIDSDLPASYELMHATIPWNYYMMG